MGRVESIDHNQPELTLAPFPEYTIAHPPFVDISYPSSAIKTAQVHLPTYLAESPCPLPALTIAINQCKRSKRNQQWDEI